MLVSTLGFQKHMAMVALNSSMILIIKGCNKLSGCRNKWMKMLKINLHQMNIRGLLLPLKTQRS